MKILIADIETTGFLAQGGKIIEIGLVELDLSNGETVTVFDELVNEGVTRQELLDSWIVKNSDIDVGKVLNSEPLKDLAPKIQNIIDSYPNGLTAFNRQFDERFLSDRGFTFPKLLPCPMLVSTDVCKLPGRFRGAYKWPKVQEAYDFFFPNNEYVELHRGADDARHEAQIVYKLYQAGFFNVS